MPDFSTQPCNFIHRDTQKTSGHIEANFPVVFLRQATHSYFVIAVIITVMSPTSIIGQTRLGQARTHDSIIGQNINFNIMQNVRALTTRVIITVQGRDQRRYLTVFATPIHGYVEFGFPTSQRRPLGESIIVYLILHNH